MQVIPLNKMQDSLRIKKNFFLKTEPLHIDSSFIYSKICNLTVRQCIQLEKFRDVYFPVPAQANKKR